MAGTEIDVIIPVYKPGKELRLLLKRLRNQTLEPSRILLVNTEKKFFDEKCTEGIDGVEVLHISKPEFDHGGTRHMAAMRLSGEFIVFMTQDAMPVDDKLLRELYRPFAEGQVCASYARQIPRPDCSVLERYTRRFNYGEQSVIKTAKDLPVLGIKTFFCSNVCAMYRRSEYEALGGFERKTIFNEDMIFAGKLIQHGKAVAYCADARVVHSHNYSSLQQFHRNFDIGVSQAEHPEVFASVKSESEGLKMVRQTAAWLVKTGKPYLLPKLVTQSAAKYLGYRLGKRYASLPPRIVKRCTMSPSYWE